MNTLLRRKRHLLKLLTTTILAAVGAFQFIHGDEVPDEEEIEEITIVDSRLPVELIGVEITDLDATPPQMSLANQLRSIAGGAVSQSGNIGSLTQLRVRGAEADHVKVLINGMALNTASTDLNFASISPAGISRIEVLNGPRSTIWGGHALAGVINLNAMPTKDSKRVYLDAGSHDARIAGADLGTTLGRTKLSAHVAHHATAGTNVAYVGDESDGFRQNAVHAGYQRDTEKVSASGFLRMTTTKSEYDPIPSDGDRHVLTDNGLLAQRVTWFIDDRFTTSMNLSRSQTTLRNFSENEQSNEWRGKLTQIAIENVGNLTSNQVLSLVLDHALENFQQTAPASVWGDPNYSESLATTGLAGEHLLTAGPFQLLTSVRQEWNDEFGDSTAWHATVTQQRHAWRWSYAVGVGIKNPTFIERFGYTPDQFLGNPELKPEQSLQHQIALERGGEAYTFAVSLFTASLVDEINGFAFDPARSQFTAANLETKSRRSGGEIRFSQAFANVALDLNYSYVKSTEGDVEEIRRPNHLANVQVLVPINDKAQIRSSLHLTGEQLDRDFSTFPATLVTLDSFVLGEASVEYDLTDQLTLHLTMKNVFDAEYEHVFGFRSPGRTVNTGARFTF